MAGAVFRSTLLVSTLWMLLGNAGRLGMQTISFIFLARVLGPEDFGAFAASLAIANMISPFIDLGTYGVIVHDISRGTGTQLAVGGSLAVTLATLPLGLILYMSIVGNVLHGVPASAGILVALGALGGAKLYNVARSVFVAHQALWRNAMLDLASGALQLSFVGVVSVLGGGLSRWCAFFLVQQALVGIVGCTWMATKWGWPTWRGVRLWQRAKAGLYFSVAGAAESANNSLDKAMLGSMSTLEATGVYSAADRIVRVAVVPLMAFLAAVYPRFFASGAQGGISAARSLAKRIVPICGAYGLLVAGILFAISPLIAGLLGSGYAHADVAIRLIAILVIIQALQYPFADALSGSGLQSLRSGGQLVALTLNFSLNLVCIPHYGWVGAAWSTIITQGALLMFLAFASRAKQGTAEGQSRRV